MAISMMCFESSTALLNSAIKYSVEDSIRFALLESIAAYGLQNPATNFSQSDGRFVDYVVKYDPDQLRDNEGRWTDGGSGTQSGNTSDPSGVAGQDARSDTRGTPQGIPQSYRRRDRAVFVRNAGSVGATRWQTPDDEKAALNVKGYPAPDYLEFDNTDPNAAKAFSEQITAAKNASPAGSAVHVYSEEEYSKMRLFVTDDGNAGFAVKPDGDIVSLFNKPGGLKGIAFSALHLAVQNGGTKLDAFDTVLPAIYAKAGFTPRSRLKWDESQSPPGWDKSKFSQFNNGEPDVVFMTYDPERKGRPYAKGEGPTVATYDEALNEQEKHLIKKWDEADHPRDESGRFAVSGSQGDLPSVPGSRPIPEGHVRLYHQTDEKSLQLIVREGLTLSHAKGIEGPKGIYAGEEGFYGKPEDRPTLEFHVPKDKWRVPFVLQDVTPDQMIATHLPWHAHARYIEENPESKANVLAGRHDDLTGDDAKAVDYIKRRAKKFDEELHPRDPAGKFTESGAGETRSAGGTAHFKESLGIKRKDMPQIRADDMPEFVEWANKQGVAIRDDTEHVSSLRPAQNEYNPANAAQLPPFALDKPLTVSSDNYVLDGTNRWVRQRNDDPHQQVKVRRIGLPVKEALKLMLRFPKAFSKDVGLVGRAAKIDLAEWIQKYEGQPREPAGTTEGGQWREGPGMAFDMEAKQWKHPKKEVSERDQQRLRELVVPPGWVNVHLNPDEKAPLQARGQDAAGRWQPKYSVEHTEAAKIAKFARGRDFAKIAPQVTASIERDMGDPEQVNEAAAMRLIQLTGIRIGGEKDKAVKHTAIGASNLKAQHIKVDGDKITLNFTGKSGVRQHMTVNDSMLSSYLRGRNLQKGDTVFGTTDSKMREYFKKTAGNEFKVKDVRMWVGTATAIKELAKVRQPKDEKQFRAMAKEVAKKVSKVLGNTPAMAMNSYIDPLVWQPWNQKFPGALEPKKRVKKGDIEDMQALLDEFYASVSFDKAIPFDWRDFPETALDPDDDEDDERTVLESDDDPLDLRKKPEQKADVRKAEYVRPFVSFRERADSTAEQLLQLVSGLHTSRLSAFGFTIEASVTGVTSYAISAQLDNRVCPVCEYMHGKEFQVDDATDALGEILKADDPEALRTLQPWPKQDDQNMSEFYEMTPAELVDRNWHIPPYHPNCRCLLVKVEDVHEIEETPSWRAAHPEPPSSFKNRAVAQADITTDEAIRIKTLLSGETGPKTKKVWNELKETYGTTVLEEVMGTTDYYVQSGGVSFPYES